LRGNELIEPLPYGFGWNVDRLFLKIAGLNHA
jgi:hypothetical protein